MAHVRTEHLDPPPPPGRAGLIAAWLLGLAGFLLDEPVTILRDPVPVSMVFGALLPLIAALAWGLRAALVASLPGLGALWCWTAWPNNGWANIPVSLLWTLWFAWHGWAAERRRANAPGWWWDIYAVQGLFSLLYALAMATVFRWAYAANPAPWAPAAPAAVPAVTVALIAVKAVLNSLLLVLAADVLLHLGLVRRACRLPLRRHGRYDTPVLAGALAIAAGVWLIDAAAMALLGRAHPAGFWREVARPDDGQLVGRLLLVTVILACGVGMARLLRRRVRLEEALRASEEDLRTTLHSLGDAVIATDARGRVVRMNPVAERLTGWPEADAVGLPLTTVFPISNATSGAPVENPVERVLASGEIVGLANHTVLQGRDGERRQIADSAAPIRRADGGVGGVVLVFRDVSEQVRLEEQLRQVQRLDSLGQLAGGIAHDLNNMLAAITGAGELLGRRLAGRTEAERPLAMILDTAGRAADLTGKLLGFARKNRPREVAVDLHQEVRGVVAILGRTIDRRIAVRCELQAARHRLVGDPALIQNAILNLALNARDAMPEGGELVFATADLSPGDPLLAALEDGAAHHVVLTVRDTGCGIPDEVQARLFEPFVTSKPAGRGTGLGLASVYGTVRAHRGAIRVASRRGEGATFTVVLPALAAAAPPTPPTTTPLPVLPTLTGLTVLIADDEEVLRILLAQHLVELGATVVQAEDGAVAVELFAAEPARFDLVILDQVMPRLSGADAFRAIAARRPELPVVIASGFADTSIPALEAAGLAGFIAKPYRRQELVELLGRRLSAAPDRRPPG